MIQLKLLVLSLCCIIFFSYFAQCAEQQQQQQQQQQEKQPQHRQQKDTGKKDIAAESSIYKIKRLSINENFTQQQKTPKQHQQPPKQQQLLNDITKTVDIKQPRTKKVKNFNKNSHGQNKKLLNKLGFTKVKGPNSHNRKRLAIESRRHASPDDSHMFIIKLPPNLHYYTNPNAAAQPDDNHHNDGSRGTLEANTKNALLQQTDKESLNVNGKKVSFPFSSNGKPRHIYHWNLPVIKKILEDKQRFPSVATATKDHLIDIKDIQTWAKPWENETVEKSYGKSSKSYKKSLKRKSPSYYAPANAVNKNSFNKYFSGNGKPKGFYVIKEHQKKPLYYKNIIT